MRDLAGPKYTEYQIQVSLHVWDLPVQDNLESCLAPVCRAICGHLRASCSTRTRRCTASRSEGVRTCAPEDAVSQGAPAGSGGSSPNQRGEGGWGKFGAERRLKKPAAAGPWMERTWNELGACCWGVWPSVVLTANRGAGVGTTSNLFSSRADDASSRRP